MTVSDFPLWSFWMREYDDNHWVLFVVEGLATPMGPLDCRIIATAVPLPSSMGTFEPGKHFTLSSSSQFASLVRRLV